MADTVAFESQLLQQQGDVDVSDYAVRIEVNRLNQGIFILLLVIGPELGTQEHVYSRPSKEMMMVWLLSIRENNMVQSSGVAVNVSKTNMVPISKTNMVPQNENGCMSGGNCGLGGDVTLTDASCQLDRAMIAR
uniref:Uncharacterized protein n=1 Tax=Romanomermis culicivorax TaxID=13658 RepID=A0A915JLD9_ROMCU